MSQSDGYLMLTLKPVALITHASIRHHDNGPLNARMTPGQGPGAVGGSSEKQKVNLSDTKSFLDVILLQQDSTE